MFTNVLSRLSNKSVLILGMAREGISTTEFLLNNVSDVKIFVTDKKSLTNLDEKWTDLLSKNNVTRVETSAVKDLQLDFFFKTPGIPKSVIEQNYEIKIPVEKLLSNTQLFFDLINSLDKKPITIGITGTKGKTTTTSQMFHLLKQADVDVRLGGNIGVPPLRMLEDNPNPSDKTYVLEMSCHQLAELTSSPQIGVIQDISPDHLDYYETFDLYFKAKSAICRFQLESDTVIYNKDSETAFKMAQLSAGEKISFSLQNTDLVKLIDDSNTPMVGRHNLYNIMPAIIVAKKLNITNDKIMQGITSFTPVPHRIELVKTVHGISFYNDSAASAPAATIAALKAFENNPVTLITGGSEKKVNFNKLAQTIIDHNVNYLVLFPTTGEKILNSLKQIDPNHPLAINNQTAHSMEEAVAISQEKSKDGDTVLMSPACASFNMFKNYEDRGNQFKQYVKKLS